jgi:hypothetical protein
MAPKSNPGRSGLVGRVTRCSYPLSLLYQIGRPRRRGTSW